MAEGDLFTIEARLSAALASTAGATSGTGTITTAEDADVDWDQPANTGMIERLQRLPNLVSVTSAQRS